MDWSYLRGFLSWIPIKDSITHNVWGWKKNPFGSMNQLECKVRWQRICELMCCFINHINSINQWLWILSNSFKLRGNSCIFHNSYFLKQKRGYFQTCQLSWHLVNCWEAEWFIWNWMIYSKQTWTHSIRTPRGTQHANRRNNDPVALFWHRYKNIEVIVGQVTNASWLKTISKCWETKKTQRLWCLVS